ARVVFLDFEDDLHQVTTDIGDFSEDAAGHAQRRGAQRFADGESDEARSGVVARNEQQDEQHDYQLDADQHHPDAHPRAQRNRVARIRLAAQARERRAGIRKGIDPYAVPRHTVAASDPDDAEQKNDGDFRGVELLEIAEVGDDDDSNEGFQDEEEFALREQIRLARLPDQFRHVAHRNVHRKIAKLHVRDQPEQKTHRADQQTAHQQRAAARPEERALTEVGKDKVRFSARLMRWFLRNAGRGDEQ